MTARCGRCGMAADALVHHATANGHAFGARGSEGDEVSEWRVHPSGETAVGAPVPVIADGALFAQVTPVWSDDDGVRVSVDWQTDDALSGPRAVALADALRQVADTAPPQ